MAEAYQRNQNDRSTYGYRQLPGSGVASGPELKTLVFASVGVALGILVGTFVASSSLRGVSPVPSHNFVPTASAASTSVSPPVAAAASAASLDSHAVQQQIPQPSVAQNSTIAKISTPHMVAVVAHKHHARKWRLAKRWSNAGHDPHTPLMESVTNSMPSNIPAPETEHAADFIAFTVEGDVTLSNYDASTKTIDTYEGESFAVAQTASDGGAISWDEYPSNVHYTCDQSGNCNLIKAGLAVPNSKRTR